MNAALFLIVGCAVLVVGYIFYGGWLAKKWGVDNSRFTPAHELEDGKDYCPAKAPVLMAHHFLLYRRRRPHQRPHSGRCVRLGARDAVGAHRRHLLRRRA